MNPNLNPQGGALNKSPQQKSPEQVLLESLNLKKGKEVEFIKRDIFNGGKTSKIPVGASQKGKLMADVVLGKEVVLDSGAELSAISGIFRRNNPQTVNDGRVVVKTESSIYELVTPLQPEFGDFGVMVGNLDKEGFTAFNSNHSSNQDAFAVSKNRNLFAVSDGVGSRMESGAVARFITMKIAEEITDLAQLRPQWIADKLKELEADDAFIKKYTTTGNQLKSGGSATLALVNRIAPSEFQVLLLGDSPVYVVDQNGAIVREFGTETAGDNQVNGDIGIQPGGKIHVSGKPVTARIKLNPGEKIIAGSDYLSDGLLTYDKKIQNQIEELEQQKIEGGCYEFEGRYIPPSKLNDAEKEKIKDNFIPWGQGRETRLADMKQTLDMYAEALQNPQKYLAERNNDPKAQKQLADWQKVAARNLGEFFKIKTAQEFYDKTTGADSWKKDDATVVIIS